MESDPLYQIAYKRFNKVVRKKRLGAGDILTIIGLAIHTVHRVKGHNGLPLSIEEKKVMAKRMVTQQLEENAGIGEDDKLLWLPLLDGVIDASFVNVEKAVRKCFQFCCGCGGSEVHEVSKNEHEMQLPSPP
jgi:hypothetical protein